MDLCVISFDVLMSLNKLHSHYALAALFNMFQHLEIQSKNASG